MNPMDAPHLTALAIAAIAAIPSGYAGAMTARALSGEPVPATATVALNLLVNVWAALVLPPDWLLAMGCALGWALIVLAAVDAVALRLPDMLTLPLIAAGIAVAYFRPEYDVRDYAIGAALGAGLFYGIATLYRAMRGREGLGLGDVKLAGAMGAWLGWQALPFAMLVACAAGFVWVGIALLRRGADALSERIPFGIALCFALWVVWLHGLPAFLDPNL